MNKTIKLLIDVARAAHVAANNTDEYGEDAVILDRRDYDDLCCALDALDKLPEIPGIAATGPAKAEHLLK